jgi:sulfate adenylyltransferase (ADP) / ATP adenylyltransferase
MQEGMDTIDSGKAGWDNLTNMLAEQELKDNVPELPFACFGDDITPEADDNKLYQVYRSLVKKGSQAVDDAQVLNLAAGMPYSYNLAMTTSAMILVPRRLDSYPITAAENHTPQSSDDQGKYCEVALNGTLLAGTLMVKDRELFEYLKHDQSGAIDRVLAGACFPSKHAKEIEEAQQAADPEPTKLWDGRFAVIVR